VREQLPEFYDPFSVCLAVTLKHARTSIQIMLRCLPAFFLGTVTGVVVATGARTGGLVLLGFLVAIGLCTVLTVVIGPRHITRFLLAVSDGTVKARPTSRVQTARRQQSEVERDVVSALVLQGVSRAAASRATLNAALQAPQDFEQLFRVAVRLLGTSRRRVSSPTKLA
jgi:hypothetical protein